MSSIDPNNLRFNLPLDPQKYAARFQSVRFSDVGGGRLGVISEVSIAISKEAPERIIVDSIR